MFEMLFIFTECGLVLGILEISESEYFAGFVTIGKHDTFVARVVKEVLVN